MHRHLLSFSLVVMALGGCAAAQPRAATPEPCVAPAPAPVVAASVAPAPGLTAADLQGFWAEYWARQGHAETQQYVFQADGSFGWLAPLRDAPQQDPLQRSGTYSIEGNVLVLRVARERFAEQRVVEHAEPLSLSLEIGECPPNQEASQLDASYQCRSIGGQAFWRRTTSEARDSSAFFQ